MQVSSIQPVGQTSLRVVDRRGGHLHVRVDGVPDVKMVILSGHKQSLLT